MSHEIIFHNPEEIEGYEQETEELFDCYTKIFEDNIALRQELDKLKSTYQ